MTELEIFCNAIKKTSKIVEKLPQDEIGCINCTRWRTGSLRCGLCYGFSEFKNEEMVRQQLREKGLDYLCATKNR